MLTHPAVTNDTFLVMTNIMAIFYGTKYFMAPIFYGTKNIDKTTHPACESTSSSSLRKFRRGSRAQLRTVDKCYVHTALIQLVKWETWHRFSHGVINLGPNGLPDLVLDRKAVVNKSMFSFICFLVS